MSDDFDRERRKNKKKNNLQHKNKGQYEISEEQKFVSKSKKAFKHKIENIRSNELWEDWSNQN